MGPLNTMSPGVIVPPWPPLGGPASTITSMLRLNYSVLTLFAQSTQPKYRALLTNNIVVDIEVECYGDNTIYRKGIISQKFLSTFLLISTQI